MGFRLQSNEGVTKAFRKSPLPESRANQAALASLRDAGEEAQFTRLLFRLHNREGGGGGGWWWCGGLKLSLFFPSPQPPHTRPPQNALHTSDSRLSCISTSCVLWRVFQTGGSACSPLSTLSSELHWATDRQRERGGGVGVVVGEKTRKKKTRQKMQMKPKKGKKQKEKVRGSRKQSAFFFVI